MPATVRPACDGPSCRVVTEFRDLTLVKRFWTDRRIFDGPCCNFVAKFRELIPRTQILEFKCFGTKRSMDHCAYDGSSYLSSRVMKESNKIITQVRDNGVHDGPSRDPSTQSVFITMILLLETTKQVVTIDTNLPIVRPRTITRRKIRARKSN